METTDWVANDRYMRRHVAAGTTLCHEGDFGDTMYFVVQGRLQISKRVIQGADKVIATLGDGQYVGELSLLTWAQRNATVHVVAAPPQVLTQESERIMPISQPIAVVM